MAEQIRHRGDDLRGNGRNDDGSRRLQPKPGTVADYGIGNGQDFRSGDVEVAAGRDRALDGVGDHFGHVVKRGELHQRICVDQWLHDRKGRQRAQQRRTAMRVAPDNHRRPQDDERHPRCFQSRVGVAFGRQERGIFSGAVRAG